MNKLKIISVVFILFGLFGFRSEKSSLKFTKEIPSDFYFTINNGATDSYNSQYNSFYRDYHDGEKTIKVELTREEKEKIYEFVLRVKFFEMPILFEPNANDTKWITNPSFQESIVVFANGNKKHVSYYTGHTSEMNEKKAKPFLDLYKMIWEILYKKKEIQELSKSDYEYR
ncbi:hypothetical protein [Flavobacterium notoginsengisoli]|uniref:hypothetical protein n=1 Tax=Flavobacterium notoginsengisoli TaxID=1478199 RepID=UPI0036427669